MKQKILFRTLLGMLSIVYITASGVLFAEPEPSSRLYGLCGQLQQASPSTQGFHPSEADCHVADSLSASFQGQFNNIYQAARQYLRQSARFRKKAAVVMDLDETLLDNRAYFVIYKTYDPVYWQQWVATAEAPALPEALAFVEWLEAHRIKLFFVSGRKESWRADTEANLKRIGVNQYRHLYLKPDDYTEASAASYKTAAYQDIQQQGYSILAVIGDQASDLKGGLGKPFKLPNTIYTIP